MLSDSPTIPAVTREARTRVIRVRKEDSAFVYFILEAHEGICSYSTLPFRPGDPYRDLELIIPVGFLAEVDELLQSLGEMVYEPDSAKGPA